MDSVPVRVNGSTPSGHDASGVKNSDKGKNRKTFKTAGIAALAAALLLIILLIGWLVYRSSLSSTIDNGRYQAVFFTNGQVYFGNLQNQNAGYFKLTNVFYLQAQTDDGSKNPQQTTDQKSSDVQLVKLGGEIHGPEDEMIIGKDQVLFFENLKKDGKVSDSINKYNSQKK